MANSASQLLKIAGVGAFAGPVILLASDIFMMVTDRKFEWTIGLWLALLLMIPAVIGLTYMLAAEGSRLAYLAGCLSFFGLMAGASMQVLFRVHAVLEEQGALTVVDQLRNTFKLVASTQMIGLAWPLGLLIFAAAWYSVRRTFLIPLLFVLAAIAFPIGRIAGSSAGVLISGVLFVVIFAVVGRQLFAAADAIE
ncbi:MAG: hypothetical protein ABI539_06185 [Acidobacteriota bacterium]